MVNYIIAVYCGERRFQSNIGIRLVERQIEYLMSNPKNVSGFTFVVNDCGNDSAVLKLIEDFIKTSSLKGCVIHRENENGSYGAWQRGIMETYKDFKYSFLIEDDYIPVVDNFTDYFIQKDSPDVRYVASLSRPNAGYPMHASISNGLLNNGKIDDVITKHKKLFCLVDMKRAPLTYSNLERDQVSFLNNIPGDYTDITDISCTIFLDHRLEFIVYNDARLPLILEPIEL